jgi:hypothetical protein
MVVKSEINGIEVIIAEAKNCVSQARLPRAEKYSA